MGVVEKWAECRNCFGEGMVSVGSSGEHECQTCDGEGGWMVLDDERPACPACEGSGSWHNGLHEDRADWGDCSHCNGTGVL